MAISDYRVSLAANGPDLLAAQRLRYQVFVQELGGTGPMVDHQNQLERDKFDDHCDHLILWHQDQAVGVYRLMNAAQAEAAGRFYTQSEFDISSLLNSGRQLLEVGRSCLAADHRQGVGMMVLWSALADFVLGSGAQVLFGVASFHGSDAAAHGDPLAVLHAQHVAPAELRPLAREPSFSPRCEVLNRKDAMRQMPALIKAYLRLGGCIGQGAYIDRAFNTTDVCLVLDVENMTPLQRSIYTRGHGR